MKAITKYTVRRAYRGIHNMSGFRLEGRNEQGKRVRVIVGFNTRQAAENFLREKLI